MNSLNLNNPFKGLKIKKGYKSCQLMNDLLDLKKIELPLKTTKIKSPYILSKARKYGYKSNKKYLVYISCIKKGGIEPSSDKRKETGNLNKRFSRNVSLQDICTNRVLRTHKNLRELKSYRLKSNKYYIWFEHLLVNLSDNSLHHTIL